jgi:hypothetical protein
MLRVDFEGTAKLIYALANERCKTVKIRISFTAITGVFGIEEEM